MNNKLFQIKSFKLHEDKIVVEIIKARKPETIIINRKEFEQWLLDSGRLYWVDGSIERYWEDENFEDNGLYDWIVLTHIAEGGFDIKQPLADILGGYFFNALKAAVGVENPFYPNDVELKKVCDRKNVNSNSKIFN